MSSPTDVYFTRGTVPELTSRRKIAIFRSSQAFCKQTVMNISKLIVESCSQSVAFFRVTPKFRRDSDLRWKSRLVTMHFSYYYINCVYALLLRVESKVSEVT